MLFAELRPQCASKLWRFARLASSSAQQISVRERQRVSMTDALSF
jgi:hypothetical protein